MAASDSESAGMDVSALDAGNYEVIRQRLEAQVGEFQGAVDALNAQRKSVFGGQELEVIANIRVRTENNCIPRDIVSLGNQLVFGYNVFVGLKKNTAVSEVLGLYRFSTESEGFKVEPLAREGSFLDDSDFAKEFADLYSYYRDAQLLSLDRTDTRLLATFQIGKDAYESKCFRWQIEPTGRLRYMDSRGEDDYRLPPTHSFEWTPTSRDDHITGRHPHLSILEEVFVETINGELTIKIENNTETGRGIYHEPVTDPNQSLDDGEFWYANLGRLILLKILPFREKNYRYLVYNKTTQEVRRIDSIGVACQELPDDQGILFPGGIYLQGGESKVFDTKTDDLDYVGLVRSPNGEDVLYAFHHRQDGRYVLLNYNVIDKALQTPIDCHGYSIFEDGTMLVFRAHDEPSRIHPMQVWRTPFTSAEFAAENTSDSSFLARVGNADLVRGISDGFSIVRVARRGEASRQGYEDLVRLIDRTLDAYYWLDRDETGRLRTHLIKLRETAELVIDEFEKVTALRKRAVEALAQAESEQAELLRSLAQDTPSSVSAFMEVLSSLRKQRGHLITLQEVRYIDRERLDALEGTIATEFDRVSRECTEFLLDDRALAPLTAELEQVLDDTQRVETLANLAPLFERLETIAHGLSMIAEVVSGLEVQDATARTEILERISAVMALSNRVRATMMSRREHLATREGRAEFAAQFQLVGQAVASALSMADSPSKCDDQLSRILVQLEELEARFSEFDEFAGQLVEKREEIYDAFSAKKQTLLEERQSRAERLLLSASRILEGVVRRASNFEGEDELNAYFASDAMILKVRQLGESLRELGDPVKADELEARLKAARQDAVRGVRDKVDLFEDGSDVIRFGTHAFSVNRQAIELTMVPKGEAMAVHLTGTDFYEEVSGGDFERTRPYWSRQLVSEDEAVYRAEYLAASILFANDANLELLHAAIRDERLLEVVRDEARERYDEGYERGVHDADAAQILEKLITLRESAGSLRFPARGRGLGCLFWLALCRRADPLRLVYFRRARSLGRLKSTFGTSGASRELAREISKQVTQYFETEHVACSSTEAMRAAQYLVDELGSTDAHDVADVHFTFSASAFNTRAEFIEAMTVEGSRATFDEDLVELAGSDNATRGCLSLAMAWVGAFLRRNGKSEEPTFETSVLLLLGSDLSVRESQALTSASVPGLLGRHPRVKQGTLELKLDSFLERLSGFIDTDVPAYREYRRLRHERLEREKARLRVEEYKPQVMTAFVRNRLIDDVYLPLIGDNLAKQVGAHGSSKRTDLMGLLLLISPPGYGKTTLMEYVANRLGMVFVKVNGPALGHDVSSLDPGDAPNATAAQEVEKMNFAFEMANNVMLYLDDIQHTNPELLQKFISLCDAQRKVEGVWAGRTRTYDFRGKRFCIVMAGNPYTESGERFQIPDMLANRADIYNLGDILNGKEHAFALSYIENALTSNATIAPLAGRDPKDTHLILRMAEGEQIATTELSYDYSSNELADMVAVCTKLLTVRDVLLAVNQQYIRSASQADAYRTEPAFKLQGSYRNMNRIAEKIVPALTEDEVELLIDQHYESEAQTLTTGAEHNLLKLAELRDRLDGERRARWEAIKSEYRRRKTMGAAEDDPVTRVTGTLTGLGRELEAIGDVLERAITGNRNGSPTEATLRRRVREVQTRLERLVEADSADANASRETVNEVLEMLRSLSDPSKHGSHSEDGT